MYCLKFLKKNRFDYAVYCMFLTIILGMFFVLVQFIEYTESSFSFNDSCYGSVFFLLTGFHGFHVIIGLIFLIICFFRLLISKHIFEVNKLNRRKSRLKKLFFYNMLFSDFSKKKKIKKFFNSNDDLFFMIVRMEVLIYFLKGFKFLNKNYNSNLTKYLDIIKIINFKNYKIKTIKNIFLILNYFNLEYETKKHFHNKRIKLKFINKHVSFKKFKKYSKNIVSLEIYKNKIDLLGELYLIGALKHLFYIRIYKNSMDMVIDKNDIKSAYNLYINLLEKNIYWFKKIESKSFFAWKGVLLWINYHYNNKMVFFSSRIRNYFLFPFLNLKRDSNIGLICASWYWHFVDAIWIVVISVIYSDIFYQVLRVIFCVPVYIKFT